MPNTPFTVRGADTAPFHISVNLPDVVSSGVEKSTGGSSVFEQPLSASRFSFREVGNKVEGSAEKKGITVYVPKGARADEKKQAEALVAFTSAARSFFLQTALGNAPDVPVRLVAVRRGAGFSDSGTVLFDADALRLSRVRRSYRTLNSRSKLRDSGWEAKRQSTEMECGVLRDGLVRFLATQFLEKQFGADAVQSELLRERIALRCSCST
jgi:hypothetical protein